MIVRNIVATLKQIEHGDLANVYALVSDQAGNYFCQDTNTFEPRTFQSLSRNRLFVPTIGKSADPSDTRPSAFIIYFSAPFPAAITAPGPYRVEVYQDPGATNLLFSAGRLIRTPDPDTSLSHYGAVQPPGGAMPDTGLFVTRSLTGAWLLSHGTTPHDPLRPQGYVNGQNAGFEVAEAFGRKCALISTSVMDDTHFSYRAGNGYPLHQQKFFTRSWTILGSVSPVPGEVGVLLQYNSLLLVRTSTGYALKHTDGSFNNVPISVNAPGFHRWALTYNGGTPPGYPLPIAPELRLYCDGQLLASVGFRAGPCLNGLALGRHFSYDDLDDLHCPAYHENYFFQRRTLAADEVEQDFLTPYQWYVRPRSFPPSSATSGR